ncbi:MAG TPA: MobF family relaxase [Bryobacteraceae bacterium]|nr:MobF family relaxase [Bryobacteraceae bacterium]
MLTIRAMSDGKGYSSRHLEHSDYYAEGERVTGQWYGRGAEMLGLRGAIDSEDFEALRQGLHPETNEFLRVRHSADRTAAGGKKLAQGRTLYDFTISAPKSVSVLAILGGDERLISAHRTAVGEALKEVEAYAASRVRKSGANENRTTGNLALALYHHDTSRELDPQLHTHAVAANLTFNGTEGRWKALQASEIYERRAYLTEVYRNALAREVRGLSYEVESQRDARGRDTGFEIRGVPAELLTRFSQRSHQRDQAIEAFIAQHGRRPSDNEVAVLVRKTRADKLAEISTRELREKQRARLVANERGLLAGLRGEARIAPVVLDPSAPSLAHAKEHTFERVSVAPDHEVLTEALRHGRGHISLASLKGELAFQESAGSVLRSGREIATSASLERERKMIAAIDRGQGAFEALGGGRPFTASDQLRPEQRQAVEFVLGSRDCAVSISGAAGTGKTATLRELRRGLMEAGRELLALAPTMSAVEELQKVGFANAITLERLLRDPQVQDDARGKVMILDEAGMVSARQMADLLQLAEDGSFRVVFSGDTRQIQSVEAGDALRILEKESRLKTVSLNQVQRQTRKDYRDAIIELRRDPERGFAKLIAMGAVREVPFVERAQAVARAYAAADGASCLVVCATHEEIDRVTEAIRERRKTRGELGLGAELVRHVSLNWTAAQKADLRNLRPGQLLGFHRAVKAIAKNETAEVIRSGPDGVVVRKADGTEHTITSKHATSFDVLEARPIEVSAGDRLLLTGNRREAGLRVTNGELVSVAAVDAAGRVHLADGRTLPANYRSFTHGYAVTAHRSQGKTVDSVIISADGMHRELFYVAASRGRRAVTVMTSDKERLQGTVARSMARTSALELLRGTGTPLRRAACRGMAIAREMVRRAAEFVQQAAITLRKERSHERGIGR